MNELIQAAQKAMNTSEVREAAEILAKYNLGVCIPHMHDEQSGSIIHLPSGIVSCERDLKVSFEEAAVAEGQGMLPVAWRWNGHNIEVCSGCCPVDGPMKS